VRRLLLVTVLAVLPVTTGVQTSVAGSVTECYSFEATFPPYAPDARFCPFPLPLPL